MHCLSLVCCRQNWWFLQRTWMHVTVRNSQLWRWRFNTITNSYIILSYPILSYPILSCPIIPYLVRCCPILSYFILCHTILCYPILCYPIFSSLFSLSSLPLVLPSFYIINITNVESLGRPSVYSNSGQWSVGLCALHHWCLCYCLRWVKPVQGMYLLMLKERRREDEIILSDVEKERERERERERKREREWEIGRERENRERGEERE